MHLTSDKPSRKMEIIEGKLNDKKIVFAQEIALAKVLAGNNKTLRDRGIKKLKKWLEVRGNGKWDFTEEEFIRICTGLFYCMWMSDKFLVQEELAENISQLIHCFKKNSDNALLFIRTFNKRLLLEYEALDQYRIDKFNMLVRRFLRQTFVYCKKKAWDEKILKKIMNDFFDVILHRDNALGFVIHFLNIYLEELAKVSNGKIDDHKILILLEPFVKLLGSSKDDRILSETEQFFNYLMKQSDVGIEFDEKFNAWKKMGFPGSGPHLLKKEPISESECFSDDENEEDEQYEELQKPLDPRAGSVHVNLPQIPLEFDGIINLFKKYEYGKQTTVKGRRKIRTLIQKFSSLKKGKFPLRIKKDLILEEKPKKNKQTEKHAKHLMEFTKKLDEEPIKTKEFLAINKLLQKEEDKVKNNIEKKEKNKQNKLNKFKYDDLENDEKEKEFENDLEKQEEKKVEGELEKQKEKKVVNNLKNLEEEQNKLIKFDSDDSESEENTEIEKGRAKNKFEMKKKKVLPRKNKTVKTKTKINSNNHLIIKENDKIKTTINKKVKTKVKKKSEKKINGQTLQDENNSAIMSKKKKLKKKPTAEKLVAKIECQNEGNEKKFSNQIKINDFTNKSLEKNNLFEENEKKIGNKRKILSDWYVQDLDKSSTTYKRIKPQRVTQFEVKCDNVSEKEENEKRKTGEVIEDFKKTDVKDTPKKLFIPTFWDKAKAKVNSKKKINNKKIFLNPFSKIDENSNSPNERRISFALERNMAQENEEYLEEVRNSPKVPFDGSKMPVQSALKSGLVPSPINPFYRIKKIKF